MTRLKSVGTQDPLFSMLKGNFKKNFWSLVGSDLEKATSLSMEAHFHQCDEIKDPVSHYNELVSQHNKLESQNNKLVS